MRATVGVFCAGLALGIGATWLLLDHSNRAGSNTPVRDLEAARTMSVELAEQHRENRYEDLNSLLQILELPSRFSQKEALYALAGRSSSGELQGLVFEANRISNDNDREDALRIVFSRLTELDPLSALALSRDALFVHEPEIESHVWQSWGRHDLENALFEAKTLASMRRQHLAAQALFRAHGDDNNAIVGRISAELGIEPDHSTTNRFLLRLANRSPAEAIEYINGLESSEQLNLIHSFVRKIGGENKDLLLELGSEIDSPIVQRLFLDAARQYAAAADPSPILERLVSSGRAGLTDTQINSAVMGIAEKDLDAAMRFFAEPAFGSQERQMLGTSIARALLKKDVNQAIQWAKSNRTDRRNQMLQSILIEVAATDPQKAIEEAYVAGSTPSQGKLLGKVLGAVASRDPQVALSFLDQMPAGPQKVQAEQSFVMQWMSRDANSAVDWLLGTDMDTARRYLSRSGQMIAFQDVDSAQRLLPLVPPEQQASWRSRITQQLAAGGSSQRAIDFVEQFKDSKDYESLKGQAVSVIARQDPDTAEKLARELRSGKTKDQAFAAIVGGRAQQDPAAAIPMLDEISNKRWKGQAAGSIGVSWYQRDPVSANNWINQMPAGEARDRAISTMASVWTESNDTTRRMIASISDSKLRGRAKLSQVQRLMQTDRAAAERLLGDPDIPEESREQIREWMGSY